MVIMKCCGIFKRVLLSPVISACVSKHLGGACYTSTETCLVKTSWSDRTEKSRKSPVVGDREHPFEEDLVADGFGVVDPQLPVLTKVSCLVDTLGMGSADELVEKLWAQFVLTATQVNTEEAWTSDEVLVVSVKFRSNLVSFQIYIVVLLIVSHLNRNATPNSVTRGWLG